MPPPVSAEELERLDTLLRSRIGPEYVQYRPQGGSNVPFLANHDVIALANETFGFDGWASTITNMTLDIETENSGRWSHGVTATVKVTLVKLGTFHEDVGYGQSENCKSRIQGLQKAKKEAVTDARKRALRIFGNGLGNCLPDKNWLKLMRGMAASAGKAPPIDKDDLRKPGKLGNGPNRRAAQSEHERLARLGLDPIHTQSTTTLAIAQSIAHDEGPQLDLRKQITHSHAAQNTKQTGALVVSNGHHNHDPYRKPPELRSPNNQDNYPRRGVNQGELTTKTNSSNNRPGGNNSMKHNNHNTYNGNNKPNNNRMGGAGASVSNNANMAGQPTDRGSNIVVQVSAPDTHSSGHNAPGSKTPVVNANDTAAAQGSYYNTAPRSGGVSAAADKNKPPTADTSASTRPRTYQNGPSTVTGMSVGGNGNMGNAANTHTTSRSVNGSNQGGAPLGRDVRMPGMNGASSTSTAETQNTGSMGMGNRPNNQQRGGARTEAQTIGQSANGRAPTMAPTAASNNRTNGAGVPGVGTHNAGTNNSHTVTAQPRRAGVSTTAAPQITANGSGAMKDTHNSNLTGPDTGQNHHAPHTNGSPVVFSRPSMQNTHNTTHATPNSAANQYTNNHTASRAQAGTSANAATINIHADLPVPKKLPGMDMSVPGGKGYRANQNAVYNAKNTKNANPPAHNGSGNGAQKRPHNGLNNRRTSGGGPAMNNSMASSANASPHQQPATAGPVSAADAMDFDIDECTRLAEGVRRSQENIVPNRGPASQRAPTHKRAKTCATDGQRLEVQAASDSLAELSSSQQNSFFDDL